MPGIVSYGVYLPYWRLDRNQIAANLLVPAGRGTRTVASHDEDTTTMAVEAARAAIAAAPPDVDLGVVLLSTADPAYLDKTNATVVHAALGLDPSVSAYDVNGSPKSGILATKAGLDSRRPTLVVLSDVRTGLPGSGDESGGGDGAAALLLGDVPGHVLAENLALASITAEFLDRWRIPGEDHSHVWEERFGEHAYLPLFDQALTDALKQAGITAGEIDHLLVCGVHDRAVRGARKAAVAAGVRPEAIVDDLTGAIGNPGTAQPGVLIADVLDRAQPGDVIVRPILADGVSVSVWRVTDALPAWRARRPATATVQAQLAAGRTDLSYPQFLTWRGQLHREPPRRPDPTPPAAPPSFRHEAWKFAFTGSTCEQCGTRHLPPARVCVGCGAVDRMRDERLADTTASIVTFTVDRLTFSMSPPVVAAVIDFDGGGRFRCEITDVDPATVAIGDRVEMTFRRISTAQSIHNYFWKARPVRGEA